MQASHSQMILAVTQAQLEVEERSDVTLALQRIVARGGDLALVLNDLAASPPEFFGSGSRFLEALVDHTFEALPGNEELIEKMEAQRRSVIGSVVTGGVPLRQRCSVPLAGCRPLSPPSSSCT